MASTRNPSPSAPSSHAPALPKPDPSPDLTEMQTRSVDCSTSDHASLLRTEWLLTDGAGGFAMGTALGAPARRYHGLLIGATRPPVGRVMAWNCVVERLVVDPGSPGEQSFELSTFRFPGGMLHPDGHRRLVRFDADGASCRWAWRIGEIEVERELTLLEPAAPSHADACLVYTIRSTRPARLVVTPLVSVRDFHSLLRVHDGWALRSEALGSTGFGVTRDALRLDIVADAGRYEHAPDWWRSFRLEREEERGQDCEEDLLAPGRFVIDAPARSGARLSERRAALRASLRPAGSPALAARDAFVESERARERTRERVGRAAAHLAKTSAAGADLAAAADQFVVARTVQGRASRTIIAGYPWFADWGRDTLLSTPGLLLATGRFDEARACLETFALHTKDGLVPNVFDDYTGEPHYNTVDASLWFLHCACAYARLSGDAAGFDELFRDACVQIIEKYTDGAPFGVHVDHADGLVTAGDASTQLTWMDAKRDGVAFTPRQGKAVEINALWIHGLRAVAETIGASDPKAGVGLVARADKAAQSFVKLFWNGQGGWLYDCLAPDDKGGWTPSRELRPNQLVAVALPHCPLSREQQKKVVQAVERSLITPMGVRTLAPDAPGFRPRYEGSMRDRDAAYHNGTCWPWLLGPYVEALLRSEQFSKASRAKAREALAPILESMDGPRRSGACLGQISEVYDATGAPDRPQSPGGCPAQAWSVAEVLRALTLIDGPA